MPRPWPITLWSYRGSTFTEADVVFNTNWDWNSYRGSLRRASSGETLIDFRRVALHEFGHVLGLDHPDEHGQNVTAQMNSSISNLDDLADDDINGARALYGSRAVESSADRHGQLQPLHRSQLPVRHAEPPRRAIRTTIR